MDADRESIYKDLEARIGRTPLVEYRGAVPNGNRILIKRECDNPFGSHYDRVYAALFRHYEEQGKIRLGDKVLETTSGSAGVSFAGIGRLLGYECFVAVPAGGERARERAILEQLSGEDHLIRTPADAYIGGFPAFLKEFLPTHKDVFFLNHSMGSRDKDTGQTGENAVALRALEGIVREAPATDYFVPAVGNGSSVLGPGRALDSRTRLVAFESVQSAVAYDLLHPGKYEAEFGISPGTLSRHRLPGTSFQGIRFPHIEHAVGGGIIHDVVLVSDRNIDEEYTQRTSRRDTEKLAHWDAELPGTADLGRTGCAGIAVALEIAKTVKGKSFLVVGYDKAERYDS